MIAALPPTCRHDAGHRLTGECIGCGAKLVAVPTTERVAQVPVTPEATPEDLVTALRVLQAILLDERLTLDVRDIADLERAARVLLDVTDRVLELER